MLAVAGAEYDRDMGSNTKIQGLLPFVSRVPNHVLG
jgi:hypothetical protein